MKKGIVLLLLLVAGLTSFAQQATTPQWNRVLSDQPETFRTQLVSSTENSIKVNVQVPGFYTTNVTTPRGEAKIISMPKTVSTAEAGEPNVPMMGIPAIIGDKARMAVRVINAQYMDFENIEVAPSKGDFPRTIDPASVPYTYGECYNQDAFFPAENVGLYEPYIVRDFRGQNMVVYPYAYNPVTKTLRVYYNMTVEMYKVDDHGANAFETRRNNVIKMDPDFKSMYQRHFINYQSAMGRYTPVNEEGDLLIICYDSFISSMTDFVNWKKTRGINTTIVGTSTAGTTYSAIKTYIRNQYNANNNLTHVLLVGDVAQIPGYIFSGNYKGDNPYGQIVGSDTYNDVFIGRFSATNTTHVATQVQKVITYERDLTSSDTWLNKGLGVSTTAGNNGHYNEDDYQHINNLRTDLMNYGYSTVYQEYYGVSGYSSTTQQISTRINSGVGIINYCNHGSETAWQSHSPYYSTSYVNALTNNNKLPFIFSVACLNGKYDYSSDCFAEAWMRATNNSQPAGAIGGMFSYISQPWIPPMWAQDEFVDILVESYSNNKKYSWGGCAINSLMAIFDHYSATSGDGYNTYQAWILYGDPSMMLRTKTPQAMTVTHSGSLPMGLNSYSVNVSNGNGTVATITDANHNILGKATVSNGTANISISGTLTVNQQLTLCVFGYNKVTYLGTITVTGGTQYAITATANPTAGGSVSGDGTYYSGTNCTLTATPNTGYSFINWTKNGSQVSTNPTYSFTVNESASYVANFQINNYSVTASADPTTGGTVTGAGNYNHGSTANLTATAAEGYTFINWTKDGEVVSYNAAYSFTVTEAVSLVAHFSMNTYQVSAASYPVEGGSVAIGGNFNVSELVFDFENGSQGWTILQGTNSDSPDSWMHCTNYSAYNLSSGLGHNDSNGFMLSESLNQQGSPVHPDNYLVSPQVLLGGSISFWATNLDNEFGAEHFAVEVSTNGNTDSDDFTPVQEWTLPIERTGGTRTIDDGVWYEYTADLGAFSGHGYVAIHHFDCYDQWLLCVDDITIVEGYSFNHGASCTVTATPNEGYTFINWTENGTEVSTDDSYSFAVTSDRMLVANFHVSLEEQAYTLQAGWTWWSANIDISLDDLKNALVDALPGATSITIKSKDFFTSFNGSGWRGTLNSNTFNPASMYEIQTPTPCTITLTGSPINPNEHTVTIVANGSTWIGFPFNQSMSLSNAFDGFAVNGDIVKSKEGFATFNGSLWRGSLQNLEPGHGYIYKSASATNRTLSFGTNINK